MKTSIIMMTLVLAGCATDQFKTTEVLVQKDYIVRTAPDTLKTLPPLPPTIPNPQAATNTQIATWINNTEEYVANLEVMVQSLVNYYEKPVTPVEAPKPVATPTIPRIVQPQTPAAAASAPKSRFLTAVERFRSQ